MNNCLGIAKKVAIVSGAAEGSTELNAFDNALIKAGIHDYNLIKVSSILAKGTKIQKFSGEIEKGSFVPCVLAKIYGKKGEKIIAGIATGFSEEGLGFVVEHTEINSDKKAVEQILLKKLKEMGKSRNVILKKEIKIKIIEHISKKKSIALVALVYIF